MKKKLFSILLSLAMIVSMMPAMANTVFAVDNVAKIDSVGYTTLEAAISAVKNNETIVMLQDVTYDTPITINNGKTFNIDFKDGSTTHSFTWDVSSGSAINRDIFTIKGSSNVTVKNMTFLTGGSDEQGNRIFNVNTTGTLTLKDMVCNNEDSTRNTPVMNNGGTVIIDGGNITTKDTSTPSIDPNGINPVVQNLNNGTTTFTGDGTYTTASGTGAAWIGRVITDYDQSTDADRDSECGTVIIENGTFNGGQILDVNGKANITINDATTGNQIGPAIKTFHGGIKSNITINNITSSTTIFSQVIEELGTKIDFRNGNVKYSPNMFCVGSSGGKMYSVSIKNGKFGPKSGTTDIQSELQDLLAPGATISPLTGDPDGYTYGVSSPPAVCKIGITDYATLEAALSAVTSGQTITMLDDISYSNEAPNFIINGKTVNIDLNGHKITVSANSMITSADGRKLFTVTNSGNLTMLNGEIVLTGMYSNQIYSFTVSGTGSTLNLVDMTQANNLDRFLTLNGGAATIKGGTFGTNNTATKINLTNNATLKLTNNPIFNCQGNVINISVASNTDADTLMGNVIIDSGDFNCTGTQTTGIVALYGKANVTITGGTFTSSNITSAPIFIGNAGYKSNVTINNLTSNSPYVFRSTDNSNIESFTATVNNGHFKYTKGKFAVDGNNGLKPKVKLKGGYYGPTESGSPVADADALAELNDNCQSGYQAEGLINTDSEYANEYRYKVVQSSQPTPVSLLRAYTGGKIGKKAVKLTWNKVSGATKYVVYGSRCGYKYKKIKTVSGTTYTVKKIKRKKLKAHKTYKFYVVAYNGNKRIKKSNSIHFITANTMGRYANVKSIKPKFDEMLLGTGVTQKINPKYKMFKNKKHVRTTHGAKLRYITNNPNVATVNKSGKVTAVGVGTATIYTQDIGGRYCTTKVRVE